MSLISIKPNLNILVICMTYVPFSYISTGPPLPVKVAVNLLESHKFHTLNSKR